MAREDAAGATVFSGWSSRGEDVCEAHRIYSTTARSHLTSTRSVASQRIPVGGRIPPRFICIGQESSLAGMCSAFLARFELCFGHVRRLRFLGGANPQRLRALDQP